MEFFLVSDSDFVGSSDIEFEDVSIYVWEVRGI